MSQRFADRASGSNKEPFETYVVDSSGTAVDLSSATVTLRMVAKDSSVTVMIAGATGSGTAGGLASYTPTITQVTLATGTLAVVDHECTWSITFPSAEVLKNARPYSHRIYRHD